MLSINDHIPNYDIQERRADWNVIAHHMSARKLLPQRASYDNRVESKTNQSKVVIKLPLPTRLPLGIRVSLDFGS